MARLRWRDRTEPEPKRTAPEKEPEAEKPRPRRPVKRTPKWFDEPSRSIRDMTF